MALKRRLSCNINITYFGFIESDFKLIALFCFSLSLSLPYIFLSSLKQFEALFCDIFSDSLVCPTTASARYKRLLTLESGNVEAPSGRRDLAGYMFLGVFVERHVSTIKSLFHFQTACIYTGFFWGVLFKNAKKSQIIYLYLPSLKLTAYT